MYMIGYISNDYFNGLTVMKVCKYFSHGIYFHMHAYINFRLYMCGSWPKNVEDV